MSLNGSPIVSPITAALCASEPLPPKFPASIYFLALSHSPPLLLINIASNNPDNIFPAKNPPIAWTPPINPTTRVAIIAISPAGINSFIAPIVAKFMHFSYSGGTFPSFTPFISLNCLCISVTNF